MVTIRQAQLDDADVFAHLAEQTFRETFATADNLTDLNLHCAQNFGTEIQRRELLDSNLVTVLAEVDAQLVAYAQIRRDSPKDCVDTPHPAELRRLYVAKVWQGRGVAHELMSQVLAIAARIGADSIWLGVWEQNPRAIAFYRKYGFRVVGAHGFQFGQDLQRDLIMMAGINQA